MRKSRQKQNHVAPGVHKKDVNTVIQDTHLGSDLCIVRNVGSVGSKTTLKQFANQDGCSSKTDRARRQSMISARRMTQA